MRFFFLSSHTHTLSKKLLNFLARSYAQNIFSLGSQQKRAHTKLAELISAANKTAARGKKLLQEMRRDVAAEQLKNKNKVADPELARTLTMRTNLVRALTKKFIETVRDYQTAQEAFKAKMQETALRQALILSPESAREDIVNFVTNENGRPEEGE